MSEEVGEVGIIMMGNPISAAFDVYYSTKRPSLARVFLKGKCRYVVIGAGIAYTAVIGTTVEGYAIVQLLDRCNGGTLYISDGEVIVKSYPVTLDPGIYIFEFAQITWL